MDKIIKNILEKIEASGYEAYLVGGFVRDFLLGIKSYDVDICTNALPNKLHNLFPSNYNANDYGGFNLKIKNYNIDITTYRKEISYEGRKPTEIVYINDLQEDIKRRDFTINSICMDKSEKIIDLVGGIDDLNKQTIKMLGDVNKRLQEDPLRILRAIRFASTLNFKIDKSLEEGIINNYELIKTLSLVRIKDELNKILLNKNFLYGLELLKKYHILKLLNIDYKDIFYVNDICGMWAQLDCNYSFAFTKQEIRNIISIREIINGGGIDNFTLYKYGLYNCLVASEVLNINKNIVNKLYKELEVKTPSDLQITGSEIMDILNMRPSKEVKEIKNELIEQILTKKLKNENKVLRNYLQNRKEM